MKDGNDDLIDGLQIMSPNELESSMKGETEDSTETGEELTDEPEITVAPVTATTGDLGDTEDEHKIVAPSEISSNTGEGVSDEKKGAFYTAVLKEMIDEGIIAAPETEEELEGSLEKMKELMKGTLEKSFKGMTDQWKGGFSGAKKKFLEIEDSFSDADQAIQAAQRLEFFDNITNEAISEDENLQKNIYYEYLKSKNFSDTEIREQIEDASAIGKLEEKAKKAVPILKKESHQFVESAKEARAQQEQEWERQREESYNNLMGAIDTKESIIDGLKLTKLTREKLKANITKPVYTDDNGRGYTSLMYKQMRNPHEFEMLVNYYDQLGLFDLNKKGQFTPNISKFKNIAKTKAVSEIDKIIASENERGVGRNSSMDTTERSKSILDLLDRSPLGQKNKRNK